MTYDEYILNSKELYHYGVLGMKWGIRRYQNEDGSLTSAGQKRLSKKISKDSYRRRPRSSKRRSRLSAEISEQINLLDPADQDVLRAARDKRREAFEKVRFGSILSKSAARKQSSLNIAEKQYSEEVKNAVDKILGEYGQVTVGSITYNRPEVVMAIQNVLNNEDY